MKTILLAMALSAITLSTSAQKLPGVQTTSILAPADIKIDGKATEWNNQFQAFNKATLFYYTMANDKDNLYLAVQATNPDVIKRILNGGITLATSVSGSKKDKNVPSVTFPISSPGNKMTINFKDRPDPAAATTQADSFMRAKNKEIGTKFKTIKTKNISQLDTLISVYNTDNIKVAGLLDINLAYTCEMAIPLKYLKIDKASKFAYHITINAAEQSGISVLNMGSPGSGQRVININTSNFAPGQYATDFWGEYTLAH